MIRRILVGALLVCSASLQAEEISFEAIMGSFSGAPEIEERATTGRIEALDYADRTASIGGYQYYFGPSTLSTPLRVKLLGRSFGSLQLLDVGMDVRVYYFESPSEHRIATELVQIEEAEQH